MSVPIPEFPAGVVSAAAATRAREVKLRVSVVAAIFYGTYYVVVTYMVGSFVQVWHDKLLFELPGCHLQFEGVAATECAEGLFCGLVGMLDDFQLHRL